MNYCLAVYDSEIVYWGPKAVWEHFLTFAETYPVNWNLRLPLHSNLKSEYSKAKLMLMNCFLWYCCQTAGRWEKFDAAAVAKPHEANEANEANGTGTPFRLTIYIRHIQLILRRHILTGR